MRNCHCKPWRWLWGSRQPLTGLIHKPGRGRQYCSKVYAERLLDYRCLRQHIHSWTANRDAFEDVNNAKRLLSSLYYVPPDEFELKY